MANFPALEPDDRTFVQGVIPWAGTTAISGAEIRFKDANVPTQHRLELGYRHRTRAELDLLLNHYRTQNGGAFPFALSAEVLAGFGSESLVPASLTWRYVGPPPTPSKGVLHDFTVTLEANA